jgi:hypothetical protein
MAYVRFATMVATSTIVMFGLMYLNTYSIAHVHLSEARVYMALLMGSTMSLIMFLFMRKMYTRRSLNICIVGLSAGVFCASLWLVRSQRAIDDIAYMKGMIPHHSVAVMTSERAQIRNPRVRRLADRILSTQVKEIREMEGLIRELQATPPPRRAPVLPPSRPGLSFLEPEHHNLDQESQWSPVGYWAETPDLCGDQYWLFTRTRPASLGARTCVVTPNAAGDWTAECKDLTKAQVVPSPISGGERIEISKTNKALRVELARCGAQAPKPDLAQFSRLRAEAAGIDYLITTRRLVRHGVVTADEIFLVQAWRQDGEVVKIVAPIGGGPAAGQDREYYFRPGQKTPFLVSDPFSIFVLVDGRIAAWLDANGELISDFVPEKPSLRESSLLAEAAALQELAIPPPARAAEATGGSSSEARTSST